jgi:hypothetical protein
LLTWQGGRVLPRDPSAAQAFGYLATGGACVCLIVLWIQAFVHDQTGHIIVVSTVVSSSRNKEFDHRAANFGPSLPPTGLRGRLVLASPDVYVCSPHNITEALGPSQVGPVFGKNFAEDGTATFEWPPWELPILLVSRGGTVQVGPGEESRPCTFVDKVRIAQAAGYGAVVVFNLHNVDSKNTMGPSRQSWVSQTQFGLLKSCSLH